MNGVALHSIELCAGVGMLGEGTAAALRFFGFQHRTICYVEREAAAAGQLVTLMEARVLDPAPIWSDLTTFDGRQWRGKVDCVIAGFPCQDLSVAGRRAGLNGKRSGLFFNVLDIADDCGAVGLVLENVSGIASATATVVDEEEGELEERAASRVVGELADRGWCAEWIHVSASDVGASHGRERWFCLAWRKLADTERAERRPQRIAGTGGIQGHDRGRPETDCGAGIADEALGNTGLQHQHLQQREVRAEPAGADGSVAHPEGDHGWRQQQPGRAQGGRAGSTGSDEALARAPINGRHEGRPEPARQPRRPDAAECDGAVADTGSAGLQKRTGGGQRQ